jgi:hypothetical protein
MSDPNDDPWADLYQDLGLSDQAAAKPTPPPLPPEDSASPRAEEAENGDTFAMAGDDEGGDDDGPDDEAEGGEAGEGQPGEEGPKKRRRRRRRRKKKPGEVAANGEAGVAPVAEGVADEVVAVPAFDEEEAEPVAEGEEVTPEMTRDLIANWNVPSWSEIVAGLHRPER